MSSPPIVNPSPPKPPTPPPPGFITSFAWLVLIALGVLVLICDALPAIGERLYPNADVVTGPVASLLALMFNYFWPGTSLVHSGLAALWLACGSWRYSLRMLVVILSMSARAGWVWLLYGIKSPHPTHFGEPFVVSGVPVLFFFIIWMTSFGFVFERFRSSKNNSAQDKLQILDLIIWTAAIALLLGPAVSFFRVLTFADLKDRLTYDSTLIMAWAALTWFSAMLLREWFLVSPFVSRALRLGVVLAIVVAICGMLIWASRFVSPIGAEDMAQNTLPTLLPSTIAWCMATGWALRELGVRIERRIRKTRAPAIHPVHPVNPVQKNA